MSLETGPDILQKHCTLPHEIVMDKLLCYHV